MDIGSTIKESFIAEQQNKYVELVVYHSAFQLLVYDWRYELFTFWTLIPIA